MVSLNIICITGLMLHESLNMSRLETIRLTGVYFISKAENFIKIFEFFARQTISNFLIPIERFSSVVCDVFHACRLFRLHCLISVITVSLAIIISTIHFSRLIFTGCNCRTFLITGCFADTSQDLNKKYGDFISFRMIQI